MTPEELTILFQTTMVDLAESSREMKAKLEEFGAPADVDDALTAVLELIAKQAAMTGQVVLLLTGVGRFVLGVE